MCVYLFVGINPPIIYSYRSIWHVRLQISSIHVITLPSSSSSSSQPRLRALRTLPSFPADQTTPPIKELFNKERTGDGGEEPAS